MKKLTDTEVKNLSSSELRESLGRGRGTLLVKHSGQTTTGYYCYLHNKKRRLVKLGTYRAPREKVSGYSLQELRDKALDFSKVKQEIAPQDLKEHLELQELDRQHKAETDRRQAEIEANRGTLQELCEAYIASLERRGADSKRKAENLLSTHCLKPFPELAKRKAREVQPEDIVTVLGKMIGEGKTTVTNRVRTYLHAAFSYGMKADHDPRQQVEHGKRFHLLFNPVAAVPRQADYERIRERRLDDNELKHMWQHIDKQIPGAKERTLLYGLLLKFCIACYGNRPQQLMRCTWQDVDFVQRTLTFIDYKGKNGTGKKRIIPLSRLAIDVLVEVKAISKGDNWIFSVNGTKPMRTEHLGRLLLEYHHWHNEQTKASGHELPENWTAKDLRTTATSILIRLRIPKEQRYLLQSREDGSVESKHYDHDDRLPEKRDAAKQYTAELERIIEGREVDTLVDLAEYRRETGR